VYLHLQATYSQPTKTLRKKKREEKKKRFVIVKNVENGRK
jgi:hypothetical protein